MISLTFIVYKIRERTIGYNVSIYFVKPVSTLNLYFVSTLCRCEIFHPQLLIIMIMIIKHCSPCTSISLFFQVYLIDVFYCYPKQLIPWHNQTEETKEMSLWSMCVCVCVPYQTQDVILSEKGDWIAELSDSISCLCASNTETEQMRWVGSLSPSFSLILFKLQSLLVASILCSLYACIHTLMELSTKWTDKCCLLWPGRWLWPVCPHSMCCVT